MDLNEIAWSLCLQGHEEDKECAQCRRIKLTIRVAVEDEIKRRMKNFEVEKDLDRLLVGHLPMPVSEKKVEAGKKMAVVMEILRPALVKYGQSAYLKGSEKWLLWFTSSNPLLGNVSPIWMIKNGRGEKLLKFIENQIEENELPT